MRTAAVSAFLIVASLAGVFALSGFIEAKRPQIPAEYSDSDLQLNGSRLKGFLLGGEGLAADVYYMRSLQYIGDKILAAKDEDIDLEDLTNLNPRLLYPLLKNATDLDPHFMAAYSYGAMVLPAIDKRQAIDLMRKGIQHNPEQWRFYQYLGYVHWRLGEFDLAAEAYAQGAAIPGASPFMKMMAAAMKTQGGSRDTARSVYHEMANHPDDENIRITGRRRLLQIDSLDERDAIDAVLANAKERAGHCPARLSEVLPMLKGVSLPGGRQFRINAANDLVDPSGVPYLLDQTNCKAIIDRDRSGIAAQ